MKACKVGFTNFNSKICFGDVLRRKISTSSQKRTRLLLLHRDAHIFIHSFIHSFIHLHKHKMRPFSSPSVKIAVLCVVVVVVAMLAVAAEGLASAKRVPVGRAGKRAAGAGAGAGMDLLG